MRASQHSAIPPLVSSLEVRPSLGPKCRSLSCSRVRHELGECHHKEDDNLDSHGRVGDGREGEVRR